MSKCFLVRSTPQIIEIIDSALDINECSDRSKLFHQLLLPYILDVIVTDKTQVSDVETTTNAIEEIFSNYIKSITGYTK